jgi:hypothetical protein
MRLEIQYLTDDKGQKMAVQIPFEQWVKFEHEYKKLKNKQRVLQDIKEGIKEIHQAKKDGKKLKTLKEFLNEC